LDPLTFIRRHLEPLAGKRILDNGCGAGGLAKALAAHGARVTGIDPAAEAVAKARTAVPDASFDVAGAEALPFAAGAFDAVVFMNSLHHVPAGVMATALDEARRVVVPGGAIIVIEPLAEGSFNDVLKFINDETEVRAQAQAALRDAATRPGYLHRDTLTFMSHETFDSFDAFLVRATAADPSRWDIVTTRRGEIEQAYGRFGSVDARGSRVLEQPLRADLLVTC
jgi:ubiquinone/menaquinone biosynthesis C-methylase UbiE